MLLVAPGSRSDQPAVVAGELLPRLPRKHQIMTNEPASPQQAQLYEFRVKGTLDGDWSDWFDNLQVLVDDDETRLYIPILDRASLYGVIATLRNLGLTLLAMNQGRPDGLEAGR